MRGPVLRFNSNIITSKENCRNIQYFHIKIVERGIPFCYSQVLVLAAGQLTTFIPQYDFNQTLSIKKTNYSIIDYLFLYQNAAVAMVDQF